MKKIAYYLILSVLCLLGIGCSSCPPSRVIYERGYKAGVAHEVRRAYWEGKQQQKEVQPVAKPRYYQIPVPAHVTHDGVKIEAHNRTVEIHE